MKLMERKDLAITIFFKVMLPGCFQQKLNLPPEISKKIQKQKSRIATLQSRLGTWKISMCRSCENGLIYLNQGWPEFVDRHALTIGDFVVFEYTGDLHFKVSVFDPSACEKEFCDELAAKKEKEKKKKKEATHETLNPKNSTVEEAKNPISYFSKTMVHSSATKNAKINIPIELMRTNNLGLRTGVTLRDPSGREWAVKLSGERVEGFRLRMATGWHDFYASNRLKNGDTCVFQLVRPLLTPTTLFFDVQISPTP